MTPKQIQASRTNGAKSRGPITENGKRKSARNSARHRLLAKTVVLEEERMDRFLDLLVGYMDEYQPQTATQVSLVETMTVARWRQLRVWGAQKAAMDRDMALQDPRVGPAYVRVLPALRGTPETLCPPDVLLRYEIAFDRQFSRALIRLLALQSNQTNQPPQPYHPDTPSGQTWKREKIPAKRTPEVIEKINPAPPALAVRPASRCALSPPARPLAPQRRNKDYAKTLNFFPSLTRCFVNLLVTLLLITHLAAQTCAPGKLRVIVTDSQQSPIFDAEVRVASATSSLGVLSTRTEGLAEVEEVPCGTWNITVSKVDFESSTQSIEIAAAAGKEVRIILTPRRQSSSVDVVEKIPPVEQSASTSNELTPTEVKQLPTNPATVEETLPLVPGILRTSRGELNIEGTGVERSAMVVNQTDITDPVTGKFGQTLPVDSIESVNVLNTPFLAQYGRFTQSVVAVETKRGGEAWHVGLNDPFPDFRIRSAHMRGIRNENPRFVLSGPLIRNRLYFISSLQYIIDKVPNRTLSFPYNISKQESINSFSQLDLILTASQELSASIHVSPQHTNFVNPDFFNPQPSTPSYAQHDYYGTLVHHWGILAGLLDSTVSIQRFDATVGAQGDAGMVLAPQGNSGNFFGTQTREASRTEWLETWSPAPLRYFGSHLVKLGTSLTHPSVQGRFAFRPVDIVDNLGVLEQRIDFSNQNTFSRTDLEVTAYAQDHWSPLARLSFDYGVRVEHQRLASSLRIAPREGIAWSPFANQRTVFRVGYGQFYDHLPLDIYTFSRYPIRTITTYAPDGSIVGDPVAYENVIGSVTGPRTFLVNGEREAGAFSPRGATLNLQAEHSFARLLRLRFVYTDNQSVGLVVFEPGALGDTREIVLNGGWKVALPPGGANREILVENQSIDPRLHPQSRRGKSEYF